MLIIDKDALDLKDKKEKKSFFADSKKVFAIKIFFSIVYTAGVCWYIHHVYMALQAVAQLR